MHVCVNITSRSPGALLGIVTSGQVLETSEVCLRFTMNSVRSCPPCELVTLARRDLFLHLSMACVLRRGYKYVAACGDKLVEALRVKGPDIAVDVDHACLCETIDTIGLYGFRHNFNALGCAPTVPH